MPGTTASRFITIKMLPRLPEETIEDFPFVDGPEFVEIRRKLARWAADNAVALGDAKPEQPPGFTIGLPQIGACCSRLPTMLAAIGQARAASRGQAFAAARRAEPRPPIACGSAGDLH